LVGLCFSNCKNETKTEEVNLEENRAKSYDQNDGFVTLKGDFVYVEESNAAVIQKDNVVYGVVIDDNMHLLNDQAKTLKKDKHDMVTVTVRVKKIENTTNANTWPYSVEIKEILKVEAPDPNKEDVIKIGN